MTQLIDRLPSFIAKYRVLSKPTIYWVHNKLNCLATLIQPYLQLLISCPNIWGFALQLDQTALNFNLLVRSKLFLQRTPWQSLQTKFVDRNSSFYCPQLFANWKWRHVWQEQKCRNLYLTNPTEEDSSLVHIQSDVHESNCYRSTGDILTFSCIILQMASSWSSVVISNSLNCARTMVKFWGVSLFSILLNFLQIVCN